MYENILDIQKKHKKAAKTVLERLLEEKHEKFIVAVSGEVGTGKAEVAHSLGRKLRKRNIHCKILHLENYYLVDPLKRLEWREKHGIEAVGLDEINWPKLQSNIRDFADGSRAVLPLVDIISGQTDELHTDFKTIDVLIIAGLYAIKLEEAELKVFIELTYKQTMDEQIASEKEEMNEFRMKVLEREHEVVQSLKNKANFYVDFDTSMELFHL
ncbi:MAG: hypothetical protein Q7J34_07170 [Bacteroidales bacterium]|nr:hypothetical protein [Bacteroidales bacterium]